MKQRTTTPDSPSCREQLRRGNVWRRLGMMLALVSTKRLGMMLAVALMTLTATTAQTQNGEAYVRISSLAQLTDGSKVIIAARYDDEHVTGYYAMKNAMSGKLGGELFESSDEGYEFLPSIITDSESDYYWIVNVTNDGYTFTNSNGERLGLGNRTDFRTNNNIFWTIGIAKSSGDAMVGGYTGFVIKNANNSGRAIAFNGEAFGAYDTINMTDSAEDPSGYNFYLDFFVLVSVPASDPVSVSYIDANGDEQTVDATEVTEGTATMGVPDSETWYFVSGEVENSNRIELLGPVNLILADGCAFKAYGGLHLVSGNTLNIFAQSEGNGYLYATNDSDNDAAIGGNGGDDCDEYGGDGEAAGNVNIYGGEVDVDGNLGGGNGGEGFDSDYDPDALDSEYDEGTGGDGGDGGTICIYGGCVHVSGAMGGGYGGYGDYSDGNYGTATITLSWTNADDKVFASWYNGGVTLQKDFTDRYGVYYEAGPVEDIDDIQGFTLLSADATLFHEQAAATCTEVGYTHDCWYKYATGWYYTDEGCTEVIAKSEVIIPALGHMIEHTEAKGATFTTAGNVEYWHCSRCNHYFGDAKGDNDLELDDASSLSYSVEGNATDGYFIRMPKWGTGTLTIDDSSVSSFQIYDDGGEGGSETDSGKPGNYSNNCDGYLVLTAPQGYTIELTGNLLTETRYDYLTVYAGTTTGGDVLINEMSSSFSESEPGMREYQSTDIPTLTASSMMLYFHSDNSDNYAGLDLTATLVQATSHAIEIAESQDGEITGPVSASYGAKVTLTAKPTGDNILTGVTVTITETEETVNVTGGTWYDNTATFLMPNAPVTVSATFSDNTDNLFINMPKTGTQTAAIPARVSSFNIYDDGGSTGNYSDKCDGYLVLTAPQGYNIQLTGNLLTESGCDYLTVYAGTTTDGDVLLNEMSSDMIETDPDAGMYEEDETPIDQEIIAPSMLLYFHSDFSNTLDGLDLKATLLPLPVVADLDNNIIDSYVGQLVTIQNMRIFDAGDNMIAFCEEGASLTPVGFSNLYDKTLVDLTGIVSLDGQDVVLTATDRSDLDPVVFVIDEDEQYPVLLVYEIENVGVRLKRTLSKDYWNTFCVPFDLSDFDGEIREFSGIDGSTMIFDRRSSIFTSQPYLVKPYEDIVNPVFRNVTLLNEWPATSGDGDYQFVGTYGPTEMSTQNDNQQVLFLKSNGSLYAPSPGKNTIKGMRAYFRAPKGTEARVSIDGAEQTVIDGVCYQSADDSPCYDLQGRRVNVPVSVPVKKGLYIQGGKKLLVR